MKQRLKVLELRQTSDFCMIGIHVVYLIAVIKSSVYIT
jgi:hypothetical protein